MKHHQTQPPRCLSPVHWPQRLLKSVAWLVIVVFSLNCLSPAIASAKTLIERPAASKAPAKTDLDKAAEDLISLEDTLDRMNRRLHGQFEFAWQATLAQKSHALPPAAATRADLQTLQTQLDTNVLSYHAKQPEVTTYFTQAKDALSTRHVSSVIQQRAKAQADTIAKLSAQLDGLLAAIDAAKTDADYKAAVAAAASFMHAHSSKPKRAKFDPKHLAFDPSGVKSRKALTDPAAIRKALDLPATAKVAGNKTAAQSLPADLAPTEDVQITAAIKAKAAALDNNPLKIYQYVRNHVEYLPTYGSIEGSDYTLQTLRGNAMDQASLLIALLRAANIPSRYVYGTIRVPIAQVENWVGNVTDPMAALNLMGQGGIPVLGLAQGGVIKFAQIEHVWVEAQLGYGPSRGAVTTPGTTWVPMDPSFKQYTYTDGMDLKTAVPFDAQGFADHIKATSTINTDQGWVQGVDQDYIQSQLTAYQTQIEDYVSTKNADATVGDVIGSKTIVPETLPLLPASLPYAVTAIASRMDTLPDNLRWKFHYALEGETLMTKSLPSLAGHLMALSFDPATAQDEATLESYIPKNITDPSQLPTSLPAGVVKLKAQFSIDGQTIATGPTYRLGDAITVTKGVYQPNQGWQDRSKSYNAGDYRAVGLDAVGISQAQVQRLQTQLEATKTALQTQQITGLTKHDLTGTLMQTSLLNYFVQIQAKAKFTARTTDMVTYRLPSFGSISTVSRVALFFGSPVKMTPVGASTDMGRVASIAVSQSGNSKAWVSYNQATGSTNSRAESGVLEQQYNNPSESHKGVTAVQALATAASQGQRIYTITQANAATTMSQLSLSNSVMQDIADSINAGLTVTTAQTSISYAGQPMAGYIIMDPSTGAGAYKIASGADGGLFLLFALSIIFVLLAVGFYGLILLVAAPFIALIAAIVVSFTLIYVLTGGEFSWCAFLKGAGWALTLIGCPILKLVENLSMEAQTLLWAVGVGSDIASCT